MALINCPECDNKVSDTLEICIHCGYKLKKKRNSEIIGNLKRVMKKKNIYTTLFCILLIFLVTIGLCNKEYVESFFYHKNKENNQRTKNIIEHKVEKIVYTEASDYVEYTGYMDWEFEYFYDTSGEILKIVDRWTESNFEYVEGRIIRQTMSMVETGDGPANKSETEYIYDGNKLVKEVSTNDDKLSSQIFYRYDEKGDMIQEKEVIVDHVTVEKNYEENKIIKERRTYLDNTSDETLYKYNSDGKVSKTIFSDMNGEQRTQVFEYNKNNDVSKIITTEDNLKEEETFDYNKNNDVIKITTTKNDSKEEQTFKYDYNKEGDPIKIEEYKNNVLLHTTTMKYEYWQ